MPVHGVQGLLGGGAPPARRLRLANLIRNSPEEAPFRGAAAGGFTDANSLTRLTVGQEMWPVLVTGITTEARTN